jgi:hypothetical protein
LAATEPTEEWKFAICLCIKRKYVRRTFTNHQTDDEMSAWPEQGIDPTYRVRGELDLGDVEQTRHGENHVENLQPCKGSELSSQ